MRMYEKTAVAVALIFPCHEIASASSQFTGHITYTLKKNATPTADQTAAYAKITIAMDSALWYYNTYTTITKKLTVNYDTTVQTADANFNGNMRFGKSRSYMVTGTAMHEIAHTVGVGTTNQWNNLMKNGIYTGTNGTNKLREITMDPKAVINGDSKAPFQHFWPYGLNYASEVKTKDDLINHCLIVNAMQKDLFPTPIFAEAPLSPQAGTGFSISLNQGNTVAFSIPSPGSVVFNVFTPSGKKVFGIAQEKNAGSHLIGFGSQNLPRGFYVYKFQAGRHVESRSFTIGK